MAEQDDVNVYLHTVEQELTAPVPRLYPCQQALSKLLESFSGVQVTGDIQRAEIGAPDLIAWHKQTPLGCIITLDIGGGLARASDNPLKSLMIAALPNVIVTDFVVFQHYVFGERLYAARLGEMQDGKLKRQRDGADSVNRLLGEFVSQIMPTIRRARDLAGNMGMLARLLRDLTVASLASESPGHDLLGLIQTFRDQLNAAITPEQFSDDLAQAVMYSLFAARLRHRGAGRSEPFRRRDVKWDLPPTNAFLKEAFDHIAGADLNPRLTWLVDIAADVLAHTDTPEVMSDFARRKRHEDPLRPFHDIFLAAFDPQHASQKLGETPPEAVIHYIVQSVDYLMRKRFKCALGLADPQAMIVDPACGTGAFFHAVVQQIYDILHQQRQIGAWNDYARDYLLPRAFGFERSLAGYALAHAKIGYQLQEKTYRFDSNQRLGIYLAHALEQPDSAPSADGNAIAGLIAAEKQAAAIPIDKPMAVVIGSPPLFEDTGFDSTWINGLVKDAYGLSGDEHPAAAYVNYMRLGQWLIDQAGSGVMVFITANNYLDDPACQTMRRSLLDSFSDIYVLNLHGEAQTGDDAPGRMDQNILAVESGLAIGVFVKEAGRTGMARLHHADLWGPRGDKLAFLDTHSVSSSIWTEIHPLQPHYLFVPHDENRAEEYEAGISLSDIFVSQSTGMTTNRDEFVMDIDPDALEARIARFRNLSIQDDDIRRSFDLRDTQTWRLTDQRRELSALPDNAWRKHFSRCLYRPFDIRALYYHPTVISQPRDDVMRHLLMGDNLALCTTNHAETFQHVLCTNVPVDNDAISPAPRERTVVFPLYVYPGNGGNDDPSPFAPGIGHRHPNLNPQFVQMAANKLRMRFVSDQVGDCKQTFGPPDVFAYIYAVLHSPTYRRRYAEFITDDFPRIPLTSDKKLFRSLVRRGRQLIDAHLMHKPSLNRLITGFVGPGTSQVEAGYPRFVEFIGERGGRVFINDTKYFEGVPQAVWAFQIGGYPVLEQWLQGRIGRVLTFEDTLYFQRVTVAISETLRLMGRIDDQIPSWPMV